MRGWTGSEYARVRLLHRRSQFLQLGILEFIDVQARAPISQAYELSRFGTDCSPSPSGG